MRYFYRIPLKFTCCFLRSNKKAKHILKMTTNGNILYIDEEQRNLDGFIYSFKDIYSINVSISTDEGLKLIKNKQFEVVIADLRINELSELEFIKQVKMLDPDIVCIIVTAYSDLSLVLDAENMYDVFRIIPKPWDERELKHAIDRAIELYGLKVRNSTQAIQLKKQNKQLRKSDLIAKQYNMLISGFFSNLNHEMRTPMNGIIGFSELLSHPRITDEKRIHYVNIIKDNAYRLLTIVNSILDLSRLEAGMVNTSRDFVDVNEMLDDIGIQAELAISTKGLDLRVFMELDQCVIITDQFHLRQIINILIDNAIKFTSSGKIEIGYIVDYAEIIFYLKDSGKGISAKKQKRIFESFFQEEFTLNRKHSGLGVGLTIANHLIRLLGGKIWLKSQQGEGSTFFFSLPLKNKNQFKPVKRKAPHLYLKTKN